MLVQDYTPEEMLELRLPTVIDVVVCMECGSEWILERPIGHEHRDEVCYCGARKFGSEADALCPQRH